MDIVRTHSGDREGILCNRAVLIFFFFLSLLNSQNSTCFLLAWYSNKKIYEKVGADALKQII